MMQTQVLCFANGASLTLSVEVEDARIPELLFVGTPEGATFVFKMKQELATGSRIFEEVEGIHPAPHA